MTPGRPRRDVGHRAAQTDRTDQTDQADQTDRTAQTDQTDRTAQAAATTGSGRRQRKERARGGRPGRSSPRRIAVLAAVAALLGAGGAADALVASPASPAAAAAPRAGATVGSPAALSSTWYCAGGTASGSGQAEATIVIANLAPRPVTGAIAAVGSSGPPRTRLIRVGAHSQIAVAENQLVRSPYGAATVVAYGGDVAVEQVVAGPLGRSAAPCASTTSSKWFVPSGSTLDGDTLLLSLYNPGSTDAVVDLSFATTSGAAAPGDFQGVVVPAGHLSVLDLGKQLVGQKTVATAVRARVGRVVVDQLGLRTSGGAKGVALTLGAPATSSTWWFPSGETGNGVTESYELFNPSGSDATVRMAIGLASGSSEPLSLTVPAGSVVSIPANRQARIPPGVPHSVKVSAADNVGIVAGRTLTSVAPSPYRGSAALVGAVSPRSAWSFAAGLTGPGSAARFIVVQDPGPRAAEVKVLEISAGTVTAVYEAQAVPTRPLSIKLADPGSGVRPALVVEATGPVIVERDSYLLGGAVGMSASVGAAAR